MMRIVHAGLSDRGRVRPQNDDRWFADAPHGLYGIVDGIAAAFAGGLAAQIVAEALPLLVSQRLQGLTDLGAPAARERLVTALKDLSASIRAESHEQPGLDGMGAAVVLGVIHDDQALITHLGDARAYLLRGRRFQRLTRDHTLAQLLLDCGEITAAEVRRHPGRDQLTRCIGMKGEAVAEVRALRLVAGDHLLLCSDGLSSALDDRELALLLHRCPTPQEACRRLIDGANERGGDDNITAVVLAVGELPVIGHR